jgi:hypothetical protein
MAAGSQAGNCNSADSALAREECSSFLRRLSPSNGRNVRNATCVTNEIGVRRVAAFPALHDQKSAWWSA